jgi:hypothetical protein
MNLQIFVWEVVLEEGMAVLQKVHSKMEQMK